jgi:hypothetical protein
MFASQWLQTGAVGMLLLTAFIVALALRFLRFVRSRDNTLALLGVAGLTLVVGFVARNLTDDFLFRSNAKELWAMTAFLLGYGMRRERILAAGDVPTQGRVTDAKGGAEHEIRDPANRSARSAHANPDPTPTAGVAPATGAPPSPRPRQSESA